MERTDRNPTRDQIRLAEHSNIMGRVVAQEKLTPNLWELTLDVSLLAQLTGGKTSKLTFYFDRKIVWRRTGKPRLDTGFNIMIRHMYECVDQDGVVYYYIAAGAILETGVHQPFRSAFYQGL